MNFFLFFSLILLSNQPVEIVKQPDRIEKVRQEVYDRLKKGGYTPDIADKWTRVGVVAQDQELLWTRDVITLPDKTDVLVNRVLLKEEMKRVLVVTPEAKVALRVVFRPTTLRYELELPRLEEGAAGKEAKLLGEISPFNQLIQSQLAIYFSSTPSFSSGQKIVYLSLNEVNKGLVEGKLLLSLEQGALQQEVALSESFLGYALYLATVKGYTRSVSII